MKKPVMTVIKRDGFPETIRMDGVKIPGLIKSVSVVYDGGPIREVDVRFWVSDVKDINIDVDAEAE